MSVEDTTDNCRFFSCLSVGCNGKQSGQVWTVVQEHWRRQPSILRVRVRSIPSLLSPLAVNRRT